MGSKLLKILCRHEGCRESVTVDESVLQAPGAQLRRPKSKTVQREVLYLECPIGHVARYEIDIHTDGTITAPTEET
jgi:hypothetical protein